MPGVAAAQFGWGEEAERICQAGQQSLPLGVRNNILVTTHRLISARGGGRYRLVAMVIAGDHLAAWSVWATGPDDAPTYHEVEFERAILLGWRIVTNQSYTGALRPIRRPFCHMGEGNAARRDSDPPPFGPADLQDAIQARATPKNGPSGD